MKERLFNEIKAVLLNKHQGSEYDFSGEVTLKTRLQEDLALDSLDMTEISFKLEDMYAITIAETEIRNWMTIGDVVDCIASKL